MTKESLHMVNFRMTQAEIDRLDKIATYCGLSRSQLIYNMVNSGMEEFDVFKKIGVMATLRTAKDVLEIIQGKQTSHAENLDSILKIKA